MKRKRLTKGIALLLSAAMLTSGCGSSDALSGMIMKVIGVNQPLSDGFKWINSEIDGAIDDTLSIKETDDFFTAVNRDWLLSTQLPKQTGKRANTNMITELGTVNQDVVQERLIDILHSETPKTLDADAPTQLTQGQTDTLQRQLYKITHEYENWEQRNRLGIEPVRKYAEAIEAISSLEDLNDYLLDDSKNLTKNYLLGISVGPVQQSDSSRNSVILDANSANLMLSASNYQSLSSKARTALIERENIWMSMLTELGYSTHQARRIIRLGMRYEIRIANIINDTSSGDGSLESYYGMIDTDAHSLDEVEAVSGALPIRDILTHLGLEGSESYTMYFPKQLKRFCALYQKRYLEEIKAYYLMHLMEYTTDLVDQKTYNLSHAEEEADDELTAEEQQKKADTKLIADIAALLDEEMEEVYAMYYCRASDKEQLTEMVKQEIEAYHEIIRSEDWLSDTTKEAALEKLDHIVINVLYPERFTDYTGLDISQKENLVDTICEINTYNTGLMRRKVNTDRDRSEWSMQGDMGTTIVNAYYLPNNNSINIFSGIIAAGSVYSADQSYEENLAKIGTIVGHEIGHAFDDFGRQYDAVGSFKDWWTREDLETYKARVKQLEKYYDIIPTYHAGGMVNGATVSGEVIGDMSGMKCALQVASKEASFDYDRFFRSFAEVWRNKKSTEAEMVTVGTDEHPLGFLRVNVTVMQYEEFYKTYGVKQGDGMYLSEKERFAVW